MCRPSIRAASLACALAAGLMAPRTEAQPAPTSNGPRVDAARLEARILTLAQFGRTPEGGVSRVAFSDADIEGRSYVMALMREAGLEVRIDPAGNIAIRVGPSGPPSSARTCVKRSRIWLSSARRSKSISDAPAMRPAT